jgi:hypothetical protein
MTINRVRELLGESEEELPAGDYFVVFGDCGWYSVSAEVAQAIERELARWLRKRWVEFIDLSGARVRLRTTTIDGLFESTGEQRARERAFRRARRREDKADRRPWEEDD